MVFSVIVDIIWLLVWGVFWWDETYFPADHWENGIHSFVWWLSCINLLIKVDPVTKVVNVIRSGPSHFHMIRLRKLRKDSQKPRFVDI